MSALVIGSGPSTPGSLTSVIMILLAALIFGFGVIPGTTIGPAFSHGRGHRPINRAERIITVLISLVLLYAGCKG